MIPFDYVTIPFVLSISLVDNGLSPRKDGSDYRAVNMIFVVETVALGQFCLRVFQFSPVSIIPQMPRAHILFVYHRRYGARGAAVG